MTLSRTILFTVFSLAAGLTACGASQPTPATSSATTSTPPSEQDAGAKAAASAEPTALTPTGTAPTESSAVWSDKMTKDQKVAFMKRHVQPKMAKVFKARDPKLYAEFGCKTCHGPENKDPDDYLPHLTLKDGKLTAFAEKPDMARWMAERVVPEMALAMGLAPYDPATHQGFGCSGCHTIERK